MDLKSYQQILFPYAYNITLAADNILSQSEEDISLSIERDLQRLIQEEIDDFVQNDPIYRHEPVELQSKRQIAFTVMDSYSGEILTMASWPHFDPNDSEYS